MIALQKNLVAIFFPVLRLSDRSEYIHKTYNLISDYCQVRNTTESIKGAICSLAKNNFSLCGMRFFAIYNMIRAEKKFRSYDDVTKNYLHNNFRQP